MEAVTKFHTGDPRHGETFSGLEKGLLELIGFI